MAALAERALVACQRLVPQHALSALVRKLAQVRSPWVKRALIRGFLKLYAVDLDEAERSDPDAYATFNEFFTRALKPGARPLCAGERTIASPCDGTVSQRGTIDGSRVLQARLEAKSRWYSLEALVADPELARAFVGGEFATIYLAPNDYHRVHMPLTGRLHTVRYVPGELYSVNAATARHVPDLFARNERVICAFDTGAGPLAVIFVGALNVGSIGLVGYGDLTPRRPRRAHLFDVPAAPVLFERGGELGRFNMGSTVILLLPRGACEWEPAFVAGAIVRTGAAIGRLTGAGTTIGAAPAPGP